MNNALCTVAAGLLVLAGVPILHAQDDSTTKPPPFQVPVALSDSVLGSVSDGKTCRYGGNDRKVHCIYGNGAVTEHIALEVLEPDFPDFGRDTRGTVSAPQDGNFAFLNAEAATRITGQSAATVCKLALQFTTTGNEHFWIWHDELRIGASGQSALVDSDGDGVADFAVRGRWNGAVNGTRKWWTADPYDASYSASDRSYPDRPIFASANGRFRGCRPDLVRIAVLTEAASHTVDSVGEGLSDILNVETTD